MVKSYIPPSQMPRASRQGARVGGIPCVACNAPINVKPAVEGGGRRGIEKGFDRSLWPGGRAFGLSCCSGVRDIWTPCNHLTTNHFPGWGISVIVDLTFLPGGREFYNNFLENMKSPPYAPLPLPLPLPLPGQLDIDRCINTSMRFSKKRMRS